MSEASHMKQIHLKMLAGGEHLRRKEIPQKSIRL